MKVERGGWGISCSIVWLAQDVGKGAQRWICRMPHHVLIVRQ